MGKIKDTPVVGELIGEAIEQVKEKLINLILCKMGLSTDVSAGLMLLLGKINLKGESTEDSESEIEEDQSIYSEDELLAIHEDDQIGPLTQEEEEQESQEETKKPKWKKSKEEQINEKLKKNKNALKKKAEGVADDIKNKLKEQTTQAINKAKEQIFSRFSKFESAIVMIAQASISVINDFGTLPPAITGISAAGPTLSPQLIIPLVNQLKSKGQTLSKFFDELQAAWQELDLGGFIDMLPDKIPGADKLMEEISSGETSISDVLSNLPIEIPGVDPERINVEDFLGKLTDEFGKITKLKSDLKDIVDKVDGAIAGFQVVPTVLGASVDITTVVKDAETGLISITKSARNPSPEEEEAMQSAQEPPFELDISADKCSNYDGGDPKTPENCTRFSPTTEGAERTCENCKLYRG